MVTQSNIMWREITSRTYIFMDNSGKVKLSCQSRRRQNNWHLKWVTWWLLGMMSSIINLKEWWRRGIWRWTMDNRRITYNININYSRWTHIRRRRILKVKRKLIEDDICRHKIVVRERENHLYHFCDWVNPKKNTFLSSKR